METEKSKVLVAGDIKDRFTVPENWMEILEKLFVNGGNEALLRVVDWLGYGHEFRCSIRNFGPYNKPVLQAHEWKKFVKYAGLQVGDKILLQELEDAQFRGASYRIIAQRIGSDGLWANIQMPQRAATNFLPFLQ